MKLSLAPKMLPIPLILVACSGNHVLLNQGDTKEQGPMLTTIPHLHHMVYV
jgi:hypothetical protein